MTNLSTSVIPWPASVLLVALALGCGPLGTEQLPQASGSSNVRQPLPPAAAPIAARTDDALLEQIASTLEFRLGRPSGIWVAPDGKQVLFRRSPPRSFVSDLYAFDVATGTERPLVRTEALLAGGAEQLTADERARRERMRLVTRGITSFSAAEDGSRLLIPLSGRLFVFERKTDQTRELTAPGPVIDPSLSPDGEHVAFVSGGDLFVTAVSGGAARRLTQRESDAIEYGVAEFVAQEEMGRAHGYWWSPDSRFLAHQRTDASQVETLYVADASHPERAPAAFRYPRAGTPNAAVSLGIIGRNGGRTTWVEWDAEEFPYLAAVSWQKNAPLTLLVQNRAQTVQRLLAADPASGRTRELLVERDPAWLNLDESELMPRWTPGGNAFFWSTERNGAWELELRKGDGTLLTTLMPAGFGYQELLGIDQPGGTVWVAASPDPRERHIYRVPLDGSDPVAVTSGRSVNALCVSTQTGVHVVSSRDHRGVSNSSVRREDGTEAGALASLAETPPHLPAPEFMSNTIEGRTYEVAILRPRSFEQGRRYPVLLSVYGGPRAAMVKLDPYAYLLDQWYADGGFIVVRIDGRGTPGRGRDWERAIHKDLARVALQDQIDVLQMMAIPRRELDLERVGILGWSFGGYLSAMAVLLRPDVFKAAVAGAPVTDWRNYDTHYTERYLGLLGDDPAPYDATSAVKHAAQLSRPLLLVHGTTDDNVYFKHSLDLAQALFRAQKPYDLLPLPGFTHMVPDPVVKKALAHRVHEFFREHLGAVDAAR